MQKSFLFVLLIFFSANFNYSYAQISNSPLFDENTGLPSGVSEQFSVDVIPEIPSPGERVSITTESYSTDFNSAYFIWSTDGSIELEGTGQKNFTFFAPESGESMTVNLRIQKNDGGELSRSFSFSPADVDIIYEADTYTPPFYKGKPLFTSEAEIKFIAMPNFVRNNQKIDASNLIYTWSVNGTVIQSSSGYGRNVFEGVGTLIQRSFIVEVVVTDPNSNLTSKGEIILSGVEPEIVLYEENPTLGIVFEKAIEGTFLLKRPEVVFQSIPYYFSTDKRDISSVDYTWRMNGQNIPGISEISSIRFRNDSGEAGRSVVGLEMQHLNKILQVAQKSITLEFEENDSINESDFEF